MIHHAANAKSFSRTRAGRTLFTFAASLLTVLSLVAWDAASKDGPLAPEKEAAARLQVFLNRAEFSPGKIDGRHGYFTLRALALYREANGLPTPASGTAIGKSDGETSEAPQDVSDLDLSSVDPIFVNYTVSEADLESVGQLPDSVEAQSKLESMAYLSVGEAVAEKFHTDVDFLDELNPGLIASLKVGSLVKVPNVKPFDLAAMKDLSDTKKTLKEGADDSAAEAGDKTKEGPEALSPETTMSVKVDTKINMISLYENDRLVAAYPVTIGANQNESPIGEWKITGVAKMPDYRHDKAMLERGERSGEFHILPPGPNNPVGVIWIQLNKKGIGLHGTSSPDTIGRSESHGCVRLANWDAVRLAAKVKAGVAVEIH